MKKFYADPMMDVKNFETENIITTLVSGVESDPQVSADQLAAAGYTVKSIKFVDIVF